MSAPRPELPRRPLELAAVVASVVVVIALWAQVRRGPASRLDRSVRAWVADHQNAQVFAVLDGVKDIGNWMLAFPVLVIVAVLAAAAARSAYPLVVTAVSLVGLAVVPLVQAAVARPGPSGVGPPAVHGAWPSGHATTAVVATLVIATIARGGGGMGWPVVLPALAVALVVGFALVYCGHHWLTDVVVAAPLAYLVVRSAVALADLTTASPAPRAPRVSAGVGARQ